MPRRLLLPLLILLLALPSSARAQDPQPAAFLQSLDASGFPQSSVRLTAADAEGRSLAGLDAASIRLEEDGRPVRGLTVARDEVGLRLVFVLHTTPVFRTRDVLGNSRLDYVRQFLQAWAAQDGPMRAGVDDVTLLTPQGALLEHSASPAEFRQAVADYDPDYEIQTPGFQLLQQGLTLASDPLPHAGMRRAVVLISSLLPALNEVPISDAVSRAGEMHTPIHALLVGPEQSVDQPGAATLQRLAGGSGGLYAYFDSPQAGQPLLELVSSYRLQYLLGYRSTLSTSGRHRLAAAVRTGDLNL
ncbi:MAG: hypothetical protein HY784_13250, partial [Chloroflexi bacterium]|nr:hypothetical protein [Chloroflexota bacterium]